MTKKKNLNYGRLLLEFVSVSFAVLFALFVNQWRDNYNNNKLAEYTILNIKLELQENKEIISEFIPKHKLTLTYIDSLISFHQDSNKLIDEEISIDLTIMNSSAWEMSKISNAFFYIDFDKANNLAKVYEFQNYYQSMVRQYILKNSIAFKSDLNINILKDNKRFLETILPIEEDLENYYNIMLTKVLEQEN